VWEWAKKGKPDFKGNLLLAHDKDVKTMLEHVKSKYVRESERLKVIGILKQFLSNFEAESGVTKPADLLTEI
jgi:hypothetical protein